MKTIVFETSNVGLFEDLRLVKDDIQLGKEFHIFSIGAPHVVAQPVDADGFILDVGGGGEGIFGKLNGSKVVAIDIGKKERQEAAFGPLKTVMDARVLQFLDSRSTESDE